MMQSRVPTNCSIVQLWRGCVFLMPSIYPVLWARDHNFWWPAENRLRSLTGKTCRRGWHPLIFGLYLLMTLALVGLTLARFSMLRLEACSYIKAQASNDRCLRPSLRHWLSMHLALYVWLRYEGKLWSGTASAIPKRTLLACRRHLRVKWGREGQFSTRVWRVCLLKSPLFEITNVFFFSFPRLLILNGSSIAEILSVVT